MEISTIAMMSVAGVGLLVEKTLAWKKGSLQHDARGGKEARSKTSYLSFPGKQPEHRDAKTVIS